MDIIHSLMIQLDLIQNIEKVKNQNKINPRSFYLPNVKKLRNKSKDFHFGLSLALTPPLKDALMGRFFNWHIRESFPRRVNETIFRGKEDAAEKNAIPKKNIELCLLCRLPLDSDTKAPI